MTKGVVGSMSTMGFITNPRLKAAKKIDYWLASRKNQCIVIPEVESYQFIKESCQGTNISLDDFCDKIKSSLNRLLLECFESVEVTVEHEAVSPNGTMFRCNIGATITENGVTYDLAKSVYFNNNTFEKIDEGRKYAKV